MNTKRVWRGRKESATQDYFCGQRLITEGRLEGCWESVTAEYPTECLARVAMSDYDT